MTNAVRLRARLVGATIVHPPIERCLVGGLLSITTGFEEFYKRYLDCCFSDAEFDIANAKMLINAFVLYRACADLTEEVITLLHYKSGRRWNYLLGFSQPPRHLFP